MREIELLDVTLRDGGYCNNFNFGEKVSNQLIATLDSAKIDYIEIGYRNGSAKPIQNIGPNGLCTTDFIQKLKTQNPTANLVLILHAKNCTEQDIHELYHSGISLVRFCIGTQLSDQDKKLIQLAKQLGLKTSGNITRITERGSKEINDIAIELSSLGIDMIYLADSNGNLTPTQTKILFENLKKVYRGKLGFHAHNNLGLAFANTIVALESGVSIIDGSLNGMGKGGGNLAIEKFVSYLKVAHENGKYDLFKIISLLESLKEKNSIQSNQESIKNLLMGAFNLSIDDEKKINATNLNQYYETALNIATQKKEKLLCSNLLN